MPEITDHPANPNDAILKRGVMSERIRDSYPSINQPYQDTLPGQSSGDS